MAYINGFVAPVKPASKEAYRVMETRNAAYFREYGALQVIAGWGDDLPRGTTTDFFMSVKAEGDENVVLSWIVWPDKATCDAAWPKIMQDERMMPGGDIPFDGKRLFWGGFEVLVQEGGWA